MPIRPDQRALYPPSWPAISRAVKEAAGWRCQRCGVAHGAFVTRHPNGSWEYANHNELVGGPEDGDRVVKIVLTVHHTVPVAEGGGHDPATLEALCQRCHNRADGPMRGRHAAATRARKRAAVAMASGQAPLAGLGVGA